LTRWLTTSATLARAREINGQRRDSRSESRAAGFNRNESLVTSHRSATRHLEYVSRDGNVAVQSEKETIMKRKILSSVLATAMLTAAALPAMADDWLEQQLQETDGYDYSTYVPAPARGVEGRAGHDQQNDTWLQHQLERTDGSGE